MNAWETATLGEIFEIARGGSPRPIEDYITEGADGINWISISDASESAKYITQTKRRIRLSGEARSRRVQPGDFLLTNSMSFGRPYIMQTTGCIHDGWLLLRPRRELHADYFYHLLGSKLVYAEFSRLAAGATVKNLNIDLVSGVKVGVPPIAEQRRIAAILDEADTLRAKRRATLARLDDLVQATFSERFGDIRINEHNWRMVKFAEVLLMPLRNGVSPATDGTVPCEVLTLTAITGQAFKATARKAALFSQPPPPEKRVAASDLLICRGNGNSSLVGRGFSRRWTCLGSCFPTR